MNQSYRDELAFARDAIKGAHGSLERVSWVPESKHKNEQDCLCIVAMNYRRVAMKVAQIDQSLGATR